MEVIFGVLIGVAGSIMVYRAKEKNQKIYWFVWVFYFLGAISLLLAFDTFRNSFLEHEAQAAWMGLGMFGGIGIIVIIAGWRLNQYWNDRLLAK